MANEIWKTFPPVRRVVTGHDANNVAKVLIDAPATNAKGSEGRSTLMWITEQNPAKVRATSAIGLPCEVSDQSIIMGPLGDTSTLSGWKSPWQRRSPSGSRSRARSSSSRSSPGTASERSTCVDTNSVIVGSSAGPGTRWSSACRRPVRRATDATSHGRRPTSVSREAT